MTREKWVVTWKNPKTRRKERKTLYDEDEAMKLIVKKTMEGIPVKHTFYPCRDNGQ